jgi:hypothetical protein
MRVMCVGEVAAMLHTERVWPQWHGLRVLAGMPVPALPVPAGFAGADLVGDGEGQHSFYPQLAG